MAKPASVTEYLSSLPADRKQAISEIRKVIRKNLPAGFKEKLNWGMITYEVPLRTYPDTYNGQPLMLAALASQKNHLAIYLTCAYIDEKLLLKIQKGYEKHGLKLRMGKSCIRFKKLEEVPLSVIAQAISAVPLKKFIALYEAGQSNKR